MQKIFLGLLVFTPITLVAEYTGTSPLIVFFLSAIAIIPLAKFIGDATEHLAARTTPALGGFLNATFGNATELIIGILALRAGLVEVVQASITGSIIGNLLLVIGLSMVAGGWKRERQTFNRTSAVAAGTTLLVSAIALIIPAVFVYSSPGMSSATVMKLSIFVSLMMILSYGASLLFSLRTHKHLFDQEEIDTTHSWSLLHGCVVLTVATIGVAFVSEALVSSITPVVETLGWTQLFIGVVFIAIIGNAAEHFSAVTVAMKNRMDLSLQIGMGSAAQIALFVAPFLVLVSLFFPTRMNLVFTPFEVAAVVLSIFIANFVVSDGESTWFEGVQLLVAYTVIGAAFFFLP